MILESERKLIRECNLEWHCHEVNLYQSQIKDGFQLNGYGIIKINKNGGLFLEFICLKSNKPLGFGKTIPEDSLDPLQSITMEALSIGGVEIKSKGLRLTTGLLDSMTPDPTLYRIILPRIEIENETDLPKEETEYLILEFNENCLVPANKYNTIESTHGTYSSSWDQTLLNYLDGEISIIRYKSFTKVVVSGSNYDMEKMRDALLFYIGITSGKFIQPYFEYNSNSNKEKTIINSIDKKKVHKNIPPPVSDVAYDNKNNRLSQEHFDVLYQIYEATHNSPDIFNSTYSQWKRIWHSFLSPEFSVPMLTVSVAIEGILNDIFIPAIQDKLKDEDFEKEKLIISDIIRSTESLKKDHIETLENFIKRWGKVTPKKALTHLKNEKVIESRHIQTWSDLRNSSAHPKLIKEDESRRRKNIKRTIVCLGLFYRLTLNIYAYKGAQYAFEEPKDNKLVIYDYVKIIP